TRTYLTICRLQTSIWTGDVGGYSRSRRPAHGRGRPPTTRSKCRNCSRRVASFRRPNERALASISYSSAASRETTHWPPKQRVKPRRSTSSATGTTPKTRPSPLGLRAYWQPTGGRLTYCPATQRSGNLDGDHSERLARSKHCAAW